MTFEFEIDSTLGNSPGCSTSAGTIEAKARFAIRFLAAVFPVRADCTEADQLFASECGEHGITRKPVPGSRGRRR
jgi:hypothetical protein